MKNSDYQRVTDSIVSMMESGVMPWNRPWSGVPLDRPVNGVSGRRYHGINVLSLWAQSENCGYASGEWYTFRQCKKLGAHVMRGEHGTMVFYASSFSKVGRSSGFASRRSDSSTSSSCS